MTNSDTLADARDVGAEAATGLFARFGTFSNTPNLIAGIGKLPGGPALEAAALRVVRDPALVAALGTAPDAPDWPLLDGAVWGLYTLAARADLAVLDELAPEVRAENKPKIGAIQRAARKHATAAPAPATPAAGGATPPGKVSEVKAWLAAHPGVDPAVLAPVNGQKVAARRAAIRALGAIGGPAALAVLAGYADTGYPDADLEELHRIWGSFDRREFARTMFLPSRGGLNLDAAKSLEGIGAVEGLTSLDVIFLGAADLDPLAECAGLTHLMVRSNVAQSVTSLEPLTRLPQLRCLDLTSVTRNADLTVLAGLPLTDLRLSLDGADGAFLLDLPGLERAWISGGKTAEDNVGISNEGYPDDVPAHPGLPAVVIELARRGVVVEVPRYGRSWVTGLVAEADPAVRVDDDGRGWALTRR